jgi:hypothetical protein
MGTGKRSAVITVIALTSAGSFLRLDSIARKDVAMREGPWRGFDLYVVRAPPLFCFKFSFKFNILLK